MCFFINEMEVPHQQNHFIRQICDADNNDLLTT